MTDAVHVTQADREAAASFYQDHLARSGEVPVAAAMRMRDIDASPLIQAFARHRLAHSQAVPALAVEALKPFANCVEQISEDEDDEEWAKFRLLIGDYRRAARALAIISTEHEDVLSRSVDGWRPIDTAPKDGTLFVGQANTDGGPNFWMLPYVMRHEGKLYSTWQYNDGATWRDWPAGAPLKRWMPLPAPPAQDQKGNGDV